MLALRIAARYLFAPKSHNAVNVIAIVAVTGVAVAVAAMVVVLSIFNGFSDLAASHMSVLDPPLLVERTDGRPIANADSLAQALSNVNGVEMAAPAVMRKALVVSDNAQMAVDIKGVASGYGSNSAIKSAIIDGTYADATSAGTPAVQISVGVANQLMLRPGAEQYIQIYAPRRVGRINPANPAASFRQVPAGVSGVFRVDQPDVDAATVIVPLSAARQLLSYSTEADAVEVYCSDAETVAKNLKLDAPYTVLTRLEQRSEAFRMISVEKWITFMMLVFVLAMALFNIVATLSLLVIEKRSNMATLHALGAGRGTISAVFVWCGILITGVGGLIGMGLGTILSFAQQWGHFITLGGGDGLTIDYYPVHVVWTDLLTVAGVVAIMAILSGLITLLSKK